jgi:hypothetical protein
MAFSLLTPLVECGSKAVMLVQPLGERLTCDPYFFGRVGDGGARSQDIRCRLLLRRVLTKAHRAYECTGRGRGAMLRRFIK